jgi:hypothetical protein
LKDEVARQRKKFEARLLKEEADSEGYTIGEGYTIEGYTIEVGVRLMHASGEFTPLVAGESALNYVDFERVFLNQKVQKTIVISNSGKFDFDFSLLPVEGDSESVDATLSNSKALSFSSTSGSVKKEECVQVTLTFQPLAGMVLDGQKLSLTLAGSMVFPLVLKGRGQQPGQTFSTSDDFGSCFVASHGNVAQPETSLEANRRRKDEAWLGSESQPEDYDPNNDDHDDGNDVDEDSDDDPDYDPENDVSDDYDPNNDDADEDGTDDKDNEDDNEALIQERVPFFVLFSWATELGKGNG